VVTQDYLRLLLKIDNIRKDSVNISLLKGRTDTITFSFNGGYGLHNINIKVDADSTISESNESNNIAVRNIFIPDFYITWDTYTHFKSKHLDI
jgi:hypothetical protein